MLKRDRDGEIKRARDKKILHHSVGMAQRDVRVRRESVYILLDKYYVVL